MLHPGHLRLFRFAKDCGERLIVAVQSDRVAGDGAHVLEHLRLESVKSINWVDEAFIYDEPLEDVLLRVRPDVIVKGKEHEHLPNMEALAVEQYGGSLVFSSGETIFSSLDLIQKEFLARDVRPIHSPVDYLTRHRIASKSLKNLLEKFSNLKICVVGDLIVDEYITCEPLGMSQEDPTIVVTPIDSTKFIGGAGIVAAHAAGLGAKVRLISVSGADVIREFALTTLLNARVDAKLLLDDSRPTTLKQRFRSKGKSLLRVSHLHQGAIANKLQQQLFASVEQIIDEIDVLVFSDFNYGCLPQPLIDKLIILAKSRGILLVADSQSSSQVGDISRFKDMDLITPTEREARISTRNREDGLVVLAEMLRQQAAARNVLLKLGDEGLLIHAEGRGDQRWLTDRIGALNSAPKDVSGAGDSLLIVSAMALACDASIWEAAYLGSLAAAIQVGRVGNTPLQVAELLSELN